MKNHALVAFLLAASLAAPAYARECTFNQEAVSSELQRIASRNAGYTWVSGNSAVEWVERRYKVRLSYGGCEDLGAEIRVERIDAARPVGTRQLIAALSRYWSATHARAVKEALASGKLTRSKEGDATLIEAAGSVSPAFPLGFTIELRDDRASVSWPVL